MKVYVQRNPADTYDLKSLVIVTPVYPIER